LTPNSVHEALKLEGQGIRLGCLELYALDHIGQLAAGSRLPPAAQTHELATAAREVEREVPIGLKEPEPANALAGDARSRSECYRSVRELHSGIRDIEMTGEDWQTGSANFGCRTSREMQDEIEIVNHEVEHHSYVGTPRLEGGKAETFDVAGPIEVGLRCSERPDLALDVADLELQFPLPGSGNQAIGFG
jgi:hypothetical protein